MKNYVPHITSVPTMVHSGSSKKDGVGTTVSSNINSGVSQRFASDVYKKQSVTVTTPEGVVHVPYNRVLFPMTVTTMQGETTTVTASQADFAYNRAQMYSASKSLKNVNFHA